MHVLSAHAALSLFAILLVFVVLALVGLHALLALGIAAVTGPVLVYGVFSDAADRLEHWLTTMR